MSVVDIAPVKKPSTHLLYDDIRGKLLCDDGGGIYVKPLERQGRLCPDLAAFSPFAEDTAKTTMCHCSICN